MIRRSSVQKRLLLAAIGGIGMAVGGGGAAHAVPSYATAQLHFENFILGGIVDASGNPLPGVTDLTTSVTTTTAAAYPTAPTSDSHSAPGDLANGSDAAQSLAGPIAATPPAENTFTQVLTPPTTLTPAGTRGDVQITGAIASGATSNLIAEGKLSVANSAASSNAGSSTTISFSFTTTAALIVSLNFDASSFLFGQVGSLGDSANPQISAIYTIVDNTDPNNPVEVASAAPTALNQNRSTLNPLVNASFSSPLTHYSFSDSLLANHTYQVTLSDNTTEILSTRPIATPEPASLALLGAGLIATGLLRHRGKSRV